MRMKYVHTKAGFTAVNWHIMVYMCVCTVCATKIRIDRVLALQTNICMIDIDSESQLLTQTQRQFNVHGSNVVLFFSLFSIRLNSRVCVCVCAGKTKEMILTNDF